MLLTIHFEMQIMFITHFNIQSQLSIQMQTCLEQYLQMDSPIALLHNYKNKQYLTKLENQNHILHEILKNTLNLTQKLKVSNLQLQRQMKQLNNTKNIVLNPQSQTKNQTSPLNTSQKVDNKLKSKANLKIFNEMEDHFVAKTNSLMNNNLFASKCNKRSNQLSNPTRLVIKLTRPRKQVYLNSTNHSISQSFAPTEVQLHTKLATITGITINKCIKPK